VARRSHRADTSYFRHAPRPADSGLLPMAEKGPPNSQHRIGAPRRNACPIIRVVDRAEFVAGRRCRPPLALDLVGGNYVAGSPSWWCPISSSFTCEWIVRVAPNGLRRGWLSALQARSERSVCCRRARCRRILVHAAASLPIAVPCLAGKKNYQPSAHAQLTRAATTRIGARSGPKGRALQVNLRHSESSSFVPA